MSDNAENNGYILYREKFLNQYKSVSERLEGFTEKVENSLNKILYIIWSSRAIRPKNNIGDDEIFFETNLHGDMIAFLNTLCETGAVEYKAGEDALIFFDPETGAEEKKYTYTLDELDKLREKDIAGHIELMKRLQPLANVEPTKIYSRYINCGGFVNRQGRQSEQMIHMIDYLDRRCKANENEITPPKLIMGHQELFYLDGCSVGYSRGGGSCIYGLFSSIPKGSNVYSEKTTSLERAVQKAVDRGILTLAHSEGRTIFSYRVITKHMVTALAQAMFGLAEERRKLAADDPLTDEIGQLAEKFVKLSDKIISNTPFDADDAKDLAKGLNEFLPMRPKIFKNFTKQDDGLHPKVGSSTKAEELLFHLMSTFNGTGMLTNSIVRVKENDLIPGLKYIVGGDREIYSGQVNDMRFSVGHSNRVILADCTRSCVFKCNNDVTKANYAIVQRYQTLFGEAFNELPRREYKDIRYSTSEAEEVYRQYVETPFAKVYLAREEKKMVISADAVEKIDEERTNIFAPVAEADTRAVVPLNNTSSLKPIEKEIIEEEITTGAEIMPDSAKNDGYELYKERF
ncbi:MAG: hypothetical protein LBP39_02225, partial [Rickettsiales bacterium]|nr:hypothetical protein [Rickettsiales bacterium]